MTRDEKLAYGRGYSAGAKGRHWPEHRPPMPPDEHVRKLLEALIELRNGAAGEIATFSGGDAIVVALAPLIDNASEAIDELSDWIVGKHAAREPKE